MTGRNECKVREEAVSWNKIQGYSSGKYYRLCLGESPHIEYVDSNFCEMLGYTEEEIHELFQNQYEQLVHPDDREKYRHFLDVMSSKESSVMMEYRLQNKAGECICVRDTMTTRRFEDGTYKSFSAVIDITDLKESYDEAATVNNVVSCGVIKFTCERYPKVLFVNKGMAKLLGIDRSGSPFLEDVRNNIYFLFPFEEKDRFRRYLELADKNRGNVNFKISIYQEHGGRKAVTGWIRKVRTEARDEYEGFFLDSEICTDSERLSLQNCFVDALISAHDTVFEINLEESTIKCLSMKNPTAKKAMVGVRMLLRDAIEYWCEKVYPQKKRIECKEFFLGLSAEPGEQTIKTLEFGIKGSFSSEISGGGSEVIRNFKGIYYSLNDTTGIFCCCQVPKTEQKKPENYLEFTLENDVIRAFWLSPETGRFLGLNEQESKHAVGDGMSIHEFFQHCPLSGEDVLDLMDTGRKTYTIGFGDGRMETKAAQLSSAAGDGETVYSLQYNMLDNESVSENDLNTESETSSDKRIAIRTFGYFDVFVNGNPIAFKSAKAKELLAILVDRRGGYVSAGDAISYLWEDEPANKVTLARYRKVAMRLKNELQDNNINDLVISLDGKRCINQKIVKCDLYEYLTDKQKNRDLFRGSYMLNYSWSEYTQAELQKN